MEDAVQKTQIEEKVDRSRLQLLGALTLAGAAGGCSSTTGPADKVESNSKYSWRVPGGDGDIMYVKKPGSDKSTSYLFNIDLEVWEATDADEARQRGLPATLSPAETFTPISLTEKRKAENRAKWEQKDKERRDREWEAEKERRKIAKRKPTVAPKLYSQPVSGGEGGEGGGEGGEGG